MKIVQCELCDDFLIPKAEDWQGHDPVFCRCGLTCTWWRIAENGLLSVWSAGGLGVVSVVGLSNHFWKVLMPESGVLKASECFVNIDQLAVRVRPNVEVSVKFEEPTFIRDWETRRVALMELYHKSKVLEVQPVRERPVGSFLWSDKKHHNL